jgi:hypothetical protein
MKPNVLHGKNTQKITTLRFKDLTAVTAPCRVLGSSETADQTKWVTLRRNSKDNQKEV